MTAAAYHKFIFSHQEEEQLVENVAKFPCLYDPSDPMFKNLEVKDRAWEEIGQHVQKSVQDCKKRWRNIKDTYHRRQKRGKGTRSSKQKQWPLADMLSFLGKVDYTRIRISNIRSVSQSDTSTTAHEEIDHKIDEPSSWDNAVDYTSQSSVSTAELPLRQKSEDNFPQASEDRSNERVEILKNLSHQHHDDDDVDLFFKSIAMSVKKLRPDLINDAKMKSLQMLFDLEARNALSSD